MTKAIRTPIRRMTRASSSTPNVRPAAAKQVHGKEALRNVIDKSRELKPTKSGWKIHDALTHLTSVDTRFHDVVVRHGLPEVFMNEVLQESATSSGCDGTASGSNQTPIPTSEKFTHFHLLLRIIVYQQLSEKAAAPIFLRLTSALGRERHESVEPQHVLDAKFDVIFEDNKKKIAVNGEVPGLSESKAKYIQDLAMHFSDPAKLQGVDLTAIHDEDLFSKLVAVKGLGPWSVHMFMMLELHRPNVLPVGDLGVRRGLCVFFGQPLKHFEDKKQQKEIPELCSCWAPYQTIGSFYMWKLSDDQQKQKRTK